MPKYSDEQLSRILTAHALGGLARGGETRAAAYPACVNQAAFASRFGAVVGEDGPTLDFQDVADIFDGEYEKDWTPVQLLRWLESRGLA